MRCSQWMGLGWAPTQPIHDKKKNIIWILGRQGWWAGLGFAQPSLPSFG